MKREEYFKSAFDKFNSGKISAEAYDAILMNADQFVDVQDISSLSGVSGDEPCLPLSEKIAMAESEKEMAHVNSKPKEFEVTITEILKKTVTIEADSLEEAEQLVTENWYKGDYILDADNFVGVEFEGKTAVEKTKDLIER